LRKQNSNDFDHILSKLLWICLEPEATVSTSFPHNSNSILQKISADKREGSKLELSGQELTDQDIQIVIQYALENNKVSVQSV